MLRVRERGPARFPLRWRLAVIIAAGLAAAVGVEADRSSRRPRPAPPGVQEEGRERVRGILGRLEASELGDSERWQRILGEAGSLLGRGAVVFTEDITAQGYFRSEFLGPTRLYVRVFLTGKGAYSHMSYARIAEAVCHESVHSISKYRASIEEEYDGFAAGLTAGLVLRGRPVTTPLMMEGKPAARYILMAYEGVPSLPEYMPVGETREWLFRQVGVR